jgi:hypothetical protein
MSGYYCGSLAAALAAIRNKKAQRHLFLRGRFRFQSLQPICIQPAWQFPDRCEGGFLCQTHGQAASALLFDHLRVGFIRQRLGFGALGFAQRSFLVSLSLFLLAPSTYRPRSLGSISSVIWLKSHRVPPWLITHLSALYKRVAMPSQRHLCASNS